MKYFSILFLLISSLYCDSSLVVVISKESPLTELTKHQVKRVFLAKTNYINSQKLKVAQIKNSSYETLFYKNALNKSRSQMHSYWATLIFRGKGHPPRSFDNLEALEKAMQNNANIITFLPSEQLTQNMRVLYRVSKE